MVTAPDRSRPTLRLENGDRLTRYEFHRRYEAHPEIKKAELIEGFVHVPSPLRAKEHAEPHAAVQTWLGVYAAAHPTTRASDNATVILDSDNEHQPDACLRYVEGGTSTIDQEGYI